MTYPLYHTLNKNVKNTAMTKTENGKLLKKLAVLDEESKKAIVLLITEHARVTEDFIVNVEKPKLPYGMKQNKENVEINMEKLPNSLKWILWKFAKL